jgi:hypothetical protein
MDKSKSLILKEDYVKNKIYTIRGLQVMLDEDLSLFYGVSTKRLNEQVKRNINRFPISFMFRLTQKECNYLRSQIATSRFDVVSKKYGGRRYLPYVFTEQGVAMLSGVLNSKTAINISVQIINAFVSMRRFISSNLEVFQRLTIIEKKQLECKIENESKFKELFNAIESKDIIPNKGIFFDGQVFDAYKFISDLIKGANKSIILIDNYIDDSVLTFFTKTKKDVNVIIYTKNITKQLSLDLKKYNTQYKTIKIKEFNKSHDRFLIIDNNEIYHIGASLKDLGKKWFAFCKLDIDINNILEKLNK